MLLHLNWRVLHKLIFFEADSTQTVQRRLTRIARRLCKTTMVIRSFRCHGYGVVLIVMLQIITRIQVSHAADPSKRIRQLRDAGFHHVEIARSEIRTRGIERTKRSPAEHLRYARATGQTDGHVEMTIHGSNETLELELLHVKSVFRESMVVSVTKGNFISSKRRNFSSCHLTGSLKSRPGSTASFAFCSSLKGLLSDGSRSYWIESVDDDDTGGSPDNVLVARKHTGNETKMCEEEKAVEHDHDLSELKSEDMSTPRHREKRQTQTFEPRTVEMVIILDEHYIRKMKETTGLTTNDLIIEHMNIRMNAAQAEWAKLNVTLDVCRIDLWETNELNFTASTSLTNTLRSICTSANKVDKYKYFDHIHLFTGLSNTDVAGKAFTGEVCKANYNCGVSTATRLMEFKIVAHEIGHNLGMSHDNTLNCTHPDTGIMGDNSTGWSTCSINSFNTLMSGTSADCLKTDDVSETNFITLTEEWPGLGLTDDEVCQLRHGPSYRYRDFGFMLNLKCTITSCVNMDANSDYYGLSYNHATPTDGRYCGTEMVCSSTAVNSRYLCITWADTGLKSSSFVTQEGGWSEFSELSNCSRTCGTGLKVKTRTCTNPKPKNSPPCTGQEHYAETCETQRCSFDDISKDGLINQRASEVCAHIKSTDFYAKISLNADDFTTSGSRYNSKAYGQCEVKCQANVKVSAFQRFGLMPDGTPCTFSATTGIVELNALPMSSGKQARCVRGYCYEFGCDGKTDPIVTRDRCGVCGGDESSCRIISDTFSDSVSRYSRSIIVTIPAMAFNIQVYFTYSAMKNFDLQLYSKDDIPIVGYNLPVVSTLDTEENPSPFAGALWRFKRTEQFLASSLGDRISEAVVVKVYNSGGNSNNGIRYEYALPPLSEMSDCSGSCSEGGTWNQGLCSCDCPSRIYGETCDSTCRRYCRNEMPFVSGSCNCDCQGNTYGLICDCKYPFTGENCAYCKKYSCQNGGTFNLTACRCTCPPGFGSLDCSTPCEDASGNTTKCLTDKDLGFCESRNELMEADCYMTCGLCDPPPDTTSTSSSSTSSTTTTTTSTTTSTTTTSTTSTTPSTTSTTTTSTTSTTPSTTSTTSTTPSTTSTTTSTTSATTSTTQSTTTPGSVSTTASTSTTTAKGKKLNILLAGILYMYALHFWI